MALTLNMDDRSRIRDLILQGDPGAATRAYRALTGEGLAAAKVYVEEVEAEVEEEFPDGLPTPSRFRWKPQPREMAFVLVAIPAILGMLVWSAYSYWYWFM